MKLIILSAAGAVFLSGAFLIFVSSLFSRDKTRFAEIWRLFFLEFALVGFFVLPWMGGYWTFSLWVLFMSLFCVYEVNKTVLFRTSADYLKILWIAPVALCFLSVTGNQEALLLGLGIVFLCFLVRDLFCNSGITNFSAMGTALFFVVYPCLFCTYLILLMGLENGFLWVACLFWVAEINDSFALVFGKAFGKKQVFPRLSPKKTYEGLIGGIVCTIFASLLFNHFVVKYPVIPFTGGISLALFTTIFGDLVTSKIKRNTQIKDFGKFFLGHGGLLDTYDSLIFGAPFFFWYVKWVLEPAI